MQSRSASLSGGHGTESVVAAYRRSRSASLSGGHGTESVVAAYRQQADERDQRWCTVGD